MAHKVWLLLVALPLFAAGCQNPRRVREVPMRDKLEPVRQPSQKDTFEVIKQYAPLEEPAGTRFFSAQGAPECPEIPLEHQKGAAAAVQPAHTGCVTLVLFWAADNGNALFALQHVSDLTQKYVRWGVRGFTVVEKTAAVGQAAKICDSYGFQLPLRYDNLSMKALKKMARCVDAEDPTAIPAIFIVDAQGRIRFYRPGFRYTFNIIQQKDHPGRTGLKESAPEGKSIEDYLKRILEER
ncbi:MAG: hypothetical protein J7M08_03075 [Planctomycetes bacterium]|nr:hypothetical protein [Planctomycetota bacterium]